MDGDRSSSEVATSPIASQAPDFPEQDESRAPTAPTPGQSSEVDKKFEEVVNSDLGVEILLGRLKHCIVAHRDVATFAKEMGGIADKQAKAAKKLVRELSDSIRATEKKKGSYASNFDIMLKAHEASADYNQQFSLKCTQLYEELTEQAKIFEDRRRQEKQNGLAAEKRGQTAEEAMRKSKTKRDGLAEDLDRVKTGDKQTGRFGLKGPKSAAQAEEDIGRKLQAADADYQQKTQNAQAARRTLLQNERPQTVHRLLAMIKEMDAQLCYELQIYVSHYENMILQTGQLLVPLGGNQGKRLAESMFSIDPDADLKQYVNSFAPKIGNTNRELKYEPHGTQRQGGQGGYPPPQPAQPAQAAQAGPNSFRQASGPAPSLPQMQHSRTFSGPSLTSPEDGSPHGQYPTQPSTLQTSDDSLGGMDSSFATMSPQNKTPMPGGPNGAGQVSSPVESSYQNSQAPQVGHYGQPRQQQPPPLSGPSSRQGSQTLMGSGPAAPNQVLLNKSAGGPGMPGPGPGPGAGPGSGPGPGALSQPPQGGGPGMPGMPGPAPGAAGAVSKPSGGIPSGPPRTPMFEVHLQALYERDGPPVPIVVTQCIQAIEMFGLNSFGIYRVAGSASHITQLRQMFDQEARAVDFRNPETFFHDINAVSGLLKLFFRSLPDGGVLTASRYADFIDAAKLEDGTNRRDSLHGIINNLPDSNYATLRALCLHLWKVQENSSVNNMTSANLAICFGPTILQPSNMRDVADAGWQVKAVETIFSNTLQIFDDD